MDQRAHALVEIGAPLDEAQRYLPTCEYEMFRQSLAPAADAYLAGGQGCPLGDYRLDERMIRYSMWLGVIGVRKQEMENRRQAQVDYCRCMDDINDSIHRFKDQLTHEKKPPFAYAPALAPYRPDSWSSLKLPTQEAIADWAAPRIEKELPPAIADLLPWKIESEMLALPHATYEVRGIPCLIWRFTIVVLVSVQVELVGRTFTRTISGRDYQMCAESQVLGRCYVGPASWGRQAGFATPIVLLALLGTGRVEGDDINLLRQDGRSMAFLVAGYDDEVTIDMDFRRFIIDMAKGGSLADGLRTAGVIDQLAADVLEKKMAALLPPVESALPASTANDDNTEVETALENMGYAKTQIAEMICSAHLLPSMSTEDKVKEVLRTAQ